MNQKSITALLENLDCQKNRLIEQSKKCLEKLERKDDFDEYLEMRVEIFATFIDIQEWRKEILKRAFVS